MKSREFSDVNGASARFDSSIGGIRVHFLLAGTGGLDASDISLSLFPRCLTSGFKVLWSGIPLPLVGVILLLY